MYIPNVLEAGSANTGFGVDGCRFCDHLSARGASEAWTVIDETERLVVVPSIGALVPGWLLVLPKEHALNLAEFGREKAPDLEREIGQIATRWSAVFGPLVWFEHGPCARDSAVGCSIDHAHMHLVPTGDIDVLAAAQSHLRDVVFEPVDGLHAATDAVDGQLPYLYLKTADEAAWLASSQSLPSQALRKVIALQQGRPEEWDWKLFPQHLTVRETIERVGGMRAAGTVSGR